MKVVRMIAISLLFGTMSTLFAIEMFQSVPLEKATIYQKGDSKIYCPNCGMHLPKFYKTSHMVKLKNGEFRQYCSLYCLIEEMEITTLRDKHDEIEKILVVDVISLKYIDAKQAYYVVGSKKKGTMSIISKYAFKEKIEAENFMFENGGTLTNFDGAYSTAMINFVKNSNMKFAKNDKVKTIQREEDIKCIKN